MLYFIKSQGAFLAARGNRGKKTVLAFRNRQPAMDMMMFYSECEPRAASMMLQKQSATSVIAVIKNTALDLLIVDSDCSYCLEPDGNYFEALGRAME